MNAILNTAISHGICHQCDWYVPVIEQADRAAIKLSNGALAAVVGAYLEIVSGFPADASLGKSYLL